LVSSSHDPQPPGLAPDSSSCSGRFGRASSATWRGGLGLLSVAVRGVRAAGLRCCVVHAEGGAVVPQKQFRDDPFFIRARAGSAIYVTSNPDLMPPAAGFVPLVVPQALVRVYWDWSDCRTSLGGLLTDGACWTGVPLCLVTAVSSAVGGSEGFVALDLDFTDQRFRVYNNASVNATLTGVTAFGSHLVAGSRVGSAISSAVALATSLGG